MYYDLGCTSVGKVLCKMDEDIHIISLVTLGTRIIIKPQTGKLCLGKVKGNSELSRIKLHEVMSIIENQEPGLLTINSIVNIKFKSHFKCGIGDICGIL